MPANIRARFGRRNLEGVINIARQFRSRRSGREGAQRSRRISKQRTPLPRPLPSEGRGNSRRARRAKSSALTTKLGCCSIESRPRRNSRSQRMPGHSIGALCRRDIARIAQTFKAGLRLVEGTSPGGTVEQWVGVPSQPSLRDLSSLCALPTLKRWAIFERPSGTEPGHQLSKATELCQAKRHSFELPGLDGSLGSCPLTTN
jgi:hypothetical protein